MGGDGGVIASNRRYMRGAGTADHTADLHRKKSGSAAVEGEDAQERMMTCALTKAPLQFQSQAIVACPYGRLYHKEAAIEALLRRKQDNHHDELGSHIRGLKDLHDVKFHLQVQSDGTTHVPACPVTGAELNGKSPAFLFRLIKDKKATTTKQSSSPNVFSQRAVKEMGKSALAVEYGPFQESEDEIRLAPPAAQMEEIIAKLRIKRESKKAGKEEKRKKRKGSTVERRQKLSAKVAKTNSKPGAAEVSHARVSQAIKTNNVLSSLFTQNDRKLSQKEKGDHLFART